tara:strand:- start:582 stop:2627 length:2046 start_codon:yes stop_codon:yes gene_type:complete
MRKYIPIIILINFFLSVEKVGFISNVVGYVEIIPKAGKDDIQVRAIEGRYVYENETVRSYDDSYCTIVFNDQTALLSIVGSSEIFLSNVDSNIKKIKLNYGQMYVENKSKIMPALTFTQSSQIHLVESSMFVNSALSGDDSIYAISNDIDIYNKKSNISLNLELNNKALSLISGEIELQKNDTSFIPDVILNSINDHSDILITPIKELGRKKGDLVPDYFSNHKIDVYESKKVKKFNLEFGLSLSSMNGNPYSKIFINPNYKSLRFLVDAELAYYAPYDDSPKIDIWNETIKILAKLRKFKYTNTNGNFEVELGRDLRDITLGHGLVVKNYSNRYNYPFYNSFGIDLDYSNRDFMNFKFFSSNIEDGFFALHASLFVSKYFPLKLGFGAAVDMNQFSEIEDQYTLPKRDIKTFEFDSTYDLYNNKGYDVDFISEIAAIIFPEPHYYKRYNSSEDLEGGLKTKNGTWGTAVGFEGFYSDFFTVKTLFHYNDPLFLPSFFNSTYNFERYRILSQKETYSGNIDQIDNMFTDLEYSDNLTIVPKDLYLSYQNEEFSYSSSGITVEGEYNYYNKILAYISYSTYFEVGNPSSSDPESSIDIYVKVLDKVLKNIDSIEFYYSKNISNKLIELTEVNQNTVLGLSFRSKIRYNLLFDLNYERVSYDFDFNGFADNIDLLELGLIYNF